VEKSGKKWEKVKKSEEKWEKVGKSGKKWILAQKSLESGARPRPEVSKNG
jgi:hypothetical protein